MMPAEAAKAFGNCWELGAAMAVLNAVMWLILHEGVKLMRYLIPVILFGLLCAVAHADDGPPPVKQDGPPAVKSDPTATKAKTCSCGCEDGGDCTCQFCPNDKAKYAEASRAALAANLPLVVFVGQERKEVDGAVAVSVGTFPDSKPGGIVVGFRGDRRDLKPGSTVADVRRLIQRSQVPPVVEAPASPSGPARTPGPAPGNERMPSARTQEQRWIMGGSAGIRNARCST